MRYTRIQLLGLSLIATPMNKCGANAQKIFTESKKNIKFGFVFFAKKTTFPVSNSCGNKGAKSQILNCR